MEEQLQFTKIEDKNVPPDSWYLCTEMRMLDADFVFYPNVIGDFSVAHLFMLGSLIKYYNLKQVIPYVLYNVAHAQFSEQYFFHQLSAKSKDPI